MKFNIPINWQNDLLPHLKHPDIIQVYGKLQEDFVGGGRPAFMLPFVSRSKVQEYIAAVNSMGINFNYLLNSVCLRNEEFTKTGERKLRKLLDWLTKIGVSHITVAVPYLVHFVKKIYPHFRITVSSLSYINSVEKAKYWDSVGVEEIVLWDTECNRNFRLLKAIRDNVKCKIQLIANNACLSHCPYRISHYLQTCHLSREKNSRIIFRADYYHLMCQFYRLNDPVEIIKSQWIRPEDIKYYDKIGVDTLKLVDRMLSTEQLEMVIKAYVNRQYSGNLIDLFPIVKNAFAKIQVPRSLKKIYAFSFNRIKIIREMEKLHDFSLDIFLDNKKLNGFIEFFASNQCNSVMCSNCNHCSGFAKQALSFNEEYLRKIKDKYASKIEQVFPRKIL